jgi:hypothetical protein
MNSVTTALNQALTVIVIAAIPVLVSYVIFGLNKLKAFVESKLTASQLTIAKSAAADAVKAAEVLGANTYINDKETWAVGWATDYLKSKHITLDVTTVVGLIKAAYLDQISMETQLPSVKKKAATAPPEPVQNVGDGTPPEPVTPPVETTPVG